MRLIAKLIFHVTAAPLFGVCFGESDHSRLPQCFLIFPAVPSLLLSHLSPPPPSLPNHLQLYLYCNCLGKQHHFGTEAALIACVWDALRVAMQTLWVCVCVCVCTGGCERVCLHVWQQLSGVRHTAAPSLCSLFLRQARRFRWFFCLSDMIGSRITSHCRFKDVMATRHDYKTLLSHINRWSCKVSNMS